MGTDQDRWTTNPHQLGSSILSKFVAEIAPVFCRERTQGAQRPSVKAALLCDLCVLSRLHFRFQLIESLHLPSELSEAMLVDLPADFVFFVFFVAIPTEESEVHSPKE